MDEKVKVAVMDSGIDGLSDVSSGSHSNLPPYLRYAAEAFQRKDGGKLGCDKRMKCVFNQSRKGIICILGPAGLRNKALVIGLGQENSREYEKGGTGRCGRHRLKEKELIKIIPNERQSVKIV